MMLAEGVQLGIAEYGLAGFMIMALLGALRMTWVRVSEITDKFIAHIEKKETETAERMGQIADTLSRLESRHNDHHDATQKQLEKQAQQLESIRAEARISHLRDG